MTELPTPHAAARIAAFLDEVINYMRAHSRRVESPDQP